MIKMILFYTITKHVSIFLLKIFVSFPILHICKREINSGLPGGEIKVIVLVPLLVLGMKPRDLYKTGTHWQWATCPAVTV